MEDYKKVIELGIAEAEKNYENMKKREKATKMRGTYIDEENRTVTFDGDVVTFDELYAKHLKNESFVGTKLNQEPLERFLRLEKAARRLGEEQSNIKEFQILGPSKNSRHATAILGIAWMAFFTKIDVQLFKELFDNADSFCISGIKDGVFRMSFDVENIYS